MTNISKQTELSSQQVFEILYQSPDTRSAIDGVLGLLGNTFQVSRVYIFEDSPDHRYCSNTFEWCAPGIAPQIDNLALLSYEEDLGGNYHENFDKNGVFYCKDITSLPPVQYEMLAAQGIRAMLQCAIEDNGEFKGMIGFDECTHTMDWTAEQLHTLQLTSHILGVFLARVRHEELLQQTNQQLQESVTKERALSQQLATIAQNTDCSITIFSISKDSYELVYANETFYKILECTPQEYAKDPIRIIHAAVSARTRSAIKAAVAKAAQTQHSGQIQHPFTHRDGSISFLNRRFSVLPQSDGETYLLISVCSDETKQKQLENQIIAEQLRGKLVLEQTDTAVFEWCMGAKSYCSKAYKQYALSNVKPQQLFSSQNLEKVVHADDTAILHQFFATLQSQERKAECVLRLKRLDGTYRWSRLLAIQIPGKKGTPLKTVGAIRDINADTEREIMHRELLNELPGGVAIIQFSPEIRVSYCNDTFLQFSNRSWGDRLDRAALCMDIIAPVDRDKFQQEVLKPAKSGKMINVSFRICTASQKFLWVHMAAAKIREDNGNAIYYAVFTRPSNEANLYREIIENSDSNIVLIDQKNAHIIFANKCFWTMTQTQQTLLREQSFLEALAVQDGACVSALLQAIPETGFYESPVILSTTGKRYVFRGKRLTWANIPAFILYIRDETENEKHLADLEQLLDRIPGGTGIFELRENKLYQVYLNNGYHRLLGCSREERKRYTGFHFLQAIYPDDRAMILEKIRQLIGGRAQADITYRVLAAKGSYLWLRVVVDTYPGDDGKPLFYCAFSNVEEQIARELELKSSKVLADVCMQNTKTCAWEYYPHSKKLVLTKAAQQLYGLPEYVENMPDYVLSQGLAHPETETEYRALFSGRFPTKQALEHEVKIRTADRKSWQWICCTVMPVYDSSGSLLKVIGTSMDISDQKRLETQYRTMLHDLDTYNEANLIGKSRYNLTANTMEYYQRNLDFAIPQADYIYDEGLRLTAATALLEQKRDELLQTLNRARLLQEFKNGNTTFIVEYQRKTPDGTIIWASTSCRTFAEPKTKDVIAFILTRDISQQKILAQIIDTVVATDYDYMVLLDCKTERYSTYAKQCGASSLDSFSRQNYSKSLVQFAQQFLLPEHRQAFLKDSSIDTIRHQLSQAETYLTYVTMLDSQGVPRRKMLKFTYLNRENSQVLLTRSDITQLYNKEQAQLLEMQAARDAAQDANRTKTDFLSRMSHDLRTPMNVIIGLTSLALDEVNNPKAMIQTLTNITTSGKYLLGLVNDCLDLEKIASGKMELHPLPYSYHDFCNSILAIIEPLCKEKEITLLLGCEPETPTAIVADRVRFEQIFYNLLSNAVKFTPVGGKISLLPKHVVSKDGWMSFDMIVRDNGIGMSEEFQQHMFEEFTQESGRITPQYQGTGLGLTIVKRLVDLMGATIAVQSKQGQGTQFTLHFRFPVADAVAPQPQDRILSETSALHGKRILLAEDHPLNAMIATKLLEKLGILVVTAANGQEALQRFQAVSTFYFDGILMDIRMPVMNGLDATSAIRSLARPDAKTIPIIAMTANAFDADIEQSRQAGMNAHLSKPIDPQVLYQTLLKWLA